MLCWLAERAIKTPDKTALIYQGRSWDFAALNEQAAHMAARLAAAGAKPGDHVAVLIGNRPEYVMLIFALARMGCVMVPLNLRLAAQEMRWQIAQADCSALACSAETEERAAALKDGRWQIMRVDEASAEGVTPGDVEVWRTGRTLSPGAAQAIIYTSGTTGSPKGAMITFANHRHSAQGSRRRLGVKAAARWLVCMPLYHVGGLSTVLRCCLYGTAVVLHEEFDAEAVSDALERDGVTMVSLVPTMLHRLMKYRGERPFPADLRCILIGGAAASPKLIGECIERGAPIALTYGLTETCSQVATATPEEVRARPGTVGRPLPGTSVRILGEVGQPLPDGEIGEIAVAGRTVMKGYYGQPEATGAAIRDGWLHTGDLGTLDEHGNLWVVQRRSDLIVSGGENVYPAEVEAALETHPSVQEVCVVGVEDAEWGQRVAALVVSASQAPDAEELIGHCRARLAGYKCPRIVHFVEALPRTASGKVQRREAARAVELWLSGVGQAG